MICRISGLLRSRIVTKILSINFSSKDTKFAKIPLSVDSLNPFVKDVEYAVRGPIPSRALDMEMQLKSGSSNWPFNKLIYTNIGDPQNLGQLPLTFPRQLLALCSYPALLNESSDLFPFDVRNRAKNTLHSFGSFGGYTHSLGVPFIRENVKRFLFLRDGYSSESSTILLSDGASSIISVILSCLSNVFDSQSGILIPIPQYPLYTACLSYHGLMPIPYYLNEESQWGLNLEELHESLKKVEGKCIPRALVVINPGNPTGQCLSYNQQEEIIQFCINKNLLLLADEVYQDNIHADNVQWNSFRKCFLANKRKLTQILKWRPSAVPTIVIGETPLTTGKLCLEYYRQLWKKLLIDGYLNWNKFSQIMSSPEGAYNFTLIQKNKNPTDGMRVRFNIFNG